MMDTILQGTQVWLNTDRAHSTYDLPLHDESDRGRELITTVWCTASTTTQSVREVTLCAEKTDTDIYLYAQYNELVFVYIAHGERCGHREKAYSGHLNEKN